MRGSIDMGKAQSEATQGPEQHPDIDDVLHQLTHHQQLPRTFISNHLDAFVDRIGSLSSWLWIITIGVILYSVISRYVFAQGSVMLEEVQWHFAGAAWLIGLSYTLVHDAHVRVDVVHERLSFRTQAWIEFLGLIFLLLPFLVLALWEVVPYAMSSFEQGELSQSPNGLPWRWVLKSFLPISMGLLVIAALSRLLKATAVLFGFPRPLTQTQTPTPPNKEV